MSFLYDTCWLESLGTCNFVTGFFDQRSAANMVKESAKMQGFEHPHVFQHYWSVCGCWPRPLYHYALHGQWQSARLHQEGKEEPCDTK